MDARIKICIISSQILDSGKIGGFGSMTKCLAYMLASQDHDVSIVVPKKEGQPRKQTVKNVTIYGVSLRDLLHPRAFFSNIDADIYHSQNPNFLTFLALRAQPQKKHVITCRDPRDIHDWVTETIHATRRRRIKTPLVYLFEDGPFISYAVKRADVIGCPAHFLKEKIARMYGRPDAILLPNLEKIPETIPEKAAEPTVCYVGRLDRRKRPERVFQLAKQFPQVKFLIVGRAEDPGRQADLERHARSLPNVEMLGYVDKFQSNQLEEIYARSWILVNTSAREGLPMTFIEAAAQGCAILSTVDPDGFASHFGYFAPSVEKLPEGMHTLLHDDLWTKRGKRAFEYVSSTYKEDNAVRVHLEIYDRLLQNKPGEKETMNT